MEHKVAKVNRAIVLAGGLGTRLRPYTMTIPKPLMPVGEFPILEIIVRQLAAFGIDHITIAVNHQAELIRAFFGDGSKWGVMIDYSLEDKPLSTMGPLRLIEELPQNFLVMNGDILTDLNFRRFADNHVEVNSNFTISSYRRDEQVDYGVLDVGSDNMLCGFREKPSISYLVSMGVYMVNRRVIDFIPYDISYGFDNLMYDLIDANIQVGVRVHEGKWLDIGRPDDYAVATENFENTPEIYLP